MRLTPLAFATFILATAAASAQTQTPQSSMPQSTMPAPQSSMPMTPSANASASATASTKMAVTPGDKMFFMKAAQGGMYEVKSSEVANGRADNDEIESFATMMVSDHSEANAKLKMLAMDKDVTLPAKLDAEHSKKLAKLKATKKGKAFEMAYVKDMVMGHEKTVALFEQASTGDHSAEVKAFATETLPTLRTHLAKIKEIQAMQMKKPA